MGRVFEAKRSLPVAWRKKSEIFPSSRHYLSVRTAHMKSRPRPARGTQGEGSLGTRAVRLLLVGTFDPGRSTLRNILTQAPWEIHEAATCAEAMRMLDGDGIGVAICDVEIKDGNWQMLLANLQSRTNPPSLIVSSRLADERLWAEVLNLGGYDVLVQPFDRGEVQRVAHMAWNHWTEGRQIRSAAAGEA